MNILKRLSPICLISSLLVFACGTQTERAQTAKNPEDPFELFNRQMHEVNVALDRSILRPVSQAYDEVTDPALKQAVAGVSANLAEPKNALNHALQGEVEPMFINATRFIYNTTVGIGGVFDPASALGLFPQPTNFDQTLASWGAPAGPYVELPVLGPNTVRSAAARVVDSQMNPVSQFIRQEYGAEALRNYIYFSILSGINSRARYGNLVDMLLYQSPDSYLATRSAYLQNQSFTSDGSTANENAGASEMIELEDFYSE